MNLLFYVFLKSNRLTQSELAQQIPVDRRTVGRWINGQSKPDSFNRDRLLESIKELTGKETTMEELGL